MQPPKIDPKRIHSRRKIAQNMDTDGDIHRLLRTRDAYKWATAFCRITGFPDHAWALAWFANAIMTGYDLGKAEPQTLVIKLKRRK